MCFSRLLSFFDLKPKPVSAPLILAPLVIPHPEEPKNPKATVENTDLSSVLAQWFDQWQVPEKFQDSWRAWPIILVPNLFYLENAYPALTWPDRTNIDPRWCNPGVLAHELAHVSWSKLDREKRMDFTIGYRVCLETYPLLTFVFSQKPYMQATLNQNDNIEGHAEVYRFLGNQMPESLKIYYLLLLEVK